jgi:(2S)-methylsuccinyl-CoA dehydrogenase
MTTMEPQTSLDAPVAPDLLPTCTRALRAAENYRGAVRHAVAGFVAPVGPVEPALLEREQVAAHGYAWLATYVTALREMLRWAQWLESEGRLGELEALLLQAAFGEYLQQMTGGIALSQVEIVRPMDLGVGPEMAVALQDDPAVKSLVARGNTQKVRARIAELIAQGREAGDFGETGLGDETLQMVREQFHKLADDYRAAAHQWHLNDELIPLEVIQQLAELGIFGLTVPEDFGGLDLGKTAMCVVTEELSRGYIGLGSLPTRSEIAAGLHRPGLAPHPLGDRRRADPPGRHRAAAAKMAAGHRLGRDPAHGGLHGTGHRLGPGRAQDPGGARR